MRETAKKALEEFVSLCKEKFGEKLISVIFFGSRVKGYERKYSDYDLLLIVKDLPSDPRKRLEEIEEIEDRIFDKYGIKISSILVEPDELFAPVNSLLFGVLTGYKILYGKKEWEKLLSGAKEWIKKMKPVYVEGVREWRIEKLL